MPTLIPLFSQNNIWVFTGNAYYGTQNNNYGDMSDTWRFRPSNRRWTWIAGSSTSGDPTVRGLFLFIELSVFIALLTFFFVLLQGFTYGTLNGTGLTYFRGREYAYACKSLHLSLLLICRAWCCRVRSAFAHDATFNRLYMYGGLTSATSKGASECLSACLVPPSLDSACVSASVAAVVTAYSSMIPSFSHSVVTCCCWQTWATSSCSKSPPQRESSLAMSRSFATHSSSSNYSWSWIAGTSTLNVARNPATVPSTNVMV